MHQRITQYDGLYGEVGPRQAEPDAARPHKADSVTDGEYLFSELLETRSRTFDWVIQPHTHARLFQVFFLEMGQVSFQEATRQRLFVGPCVLLIPPMALHGFMYSADATGRILTLSESVLSGLFPATASPVSAESALAPMLGAVQCLTDFTEQNTAQAVGTLLQQIDCELVDNQPEKRAMLDAFLQRLFLVFYRLWCREEAEEATLNHPSVKHFRRFQQRVHQVGTMCSIAQLADDLAITPVHLNRICRAVAGKSASQLVQVHILNEACKYLTYTSYSVSEIAYLLHFEYPNYFAKFFRKHTGQSPTEFRAGQ